MGPESGAGVGDKTAGGFLTGAGLDETATSAGSVLTFKEGPYQDRPPLCPFRLLPLLIYSGSAIAFLKFQGPKSKNIENRKYNPPSTLNSNQIPQMQQ